MIQLGYFCSNNPSISESFIYDLLKDFTFSKEINVNFISGSSKALIIDFKIESYSTGFYDKYSKTAFRIHKLLTLKGNSAEFYRMRFNQWKSLQLLTKAKLPKIDVAYVEYASTGILAMEYFEKNNIPFIVHVHGFDVTSTLNDKAYFAELKLLFIKADKFITPSKHLRRLLITLGCLPEKILTVYPVTTLNNINEPDWEARFKNPPTITFLGRLTDKKNPYALLHAFKIVVNEFPEAQLNILGDGPLASDLLLLVKSLSLENHVHFIGVVNRETAFGYLKSSWIYAQHSVTARNGDQEGFPVSLAEAAAHSLPLVSTIHSGITENIVHEETGYLVQEYDFEAMAKHIIYLIKNPKMVIQLGNNARAHILNLCKEGERSRKITNAIKSLHLKKRS